MASSSGVAVASCGHSARQVAGRRSLGLSGTMTQRRPARVSAWTLGGALLIASAVIGFVGAGPGAGPWARLASAVVFAAAVTTLALGLPNGGSVTRRRPLGTAALLVLAGATVVSAVLWMLASGWVQAPGQRPAAAVMSAAFVVDLAVRAASALVAAVQIGRAGVVPPPWNWAPAWVLAAVAVQTIGTQVIFAAAGSGAQQWASPLADVGALVSFGGPVFLGVLALVLDRRRRSTHRVFP